ncbi:MAG: AAA family ATPase [Candidatus Methanomethylophilaceae archaeon]|nr:AAA family ATPase [Candidatus Methanomethylophilaceae archaeon]
MLQVAVYGKGGIGKSTISANISVSLASRGCKVHQIGCDPKHDSTRLLMGGESQTTVLDYVRTVPIGRRKLDDVIVKGTAGVLCTEAGGPEPGIGCAGRGILTTFDTLRKLGADDLDLDFRIYDVLGDVVCGGFAVPLRGEYANAVILVTSGEFMAMYAANNIMKGLANFDTGKPRLLGVVLNCRGVENEEASVRAFAEAAGTKVIAVIPRDGKFREAESAGKTVRELYPDSVPSKQADAIADAIVKVAEGKMELTYPHPLDDDQMTDLAAGRPIRAPSGEVPQARILCDGCQVKRRTSIKDTGMMQSCAAYGALAAFAKMNDVGIVLHGPMSCLHLMGTTRGKAVVEQFQKHRFKVPPGYNMYCSGMDDSMSIFGGTRLLEETLEKAAAVGYRDIAVITTCMPGIIGDDTKGVVETVSARHPGTRFHTVLTDGDINGEYTDGFMMGAKAIAGMIDVSRPRGKGMVNIIGSSFYDLHTRRHLHELTRVLSLFGLRENCRFLDETTSDNIIGYCEAEFDFMINDTRATREMAEILKERTGREPFPLPLPIGLYDYEEWLERLGEATGHPEAAKVEIADVERRYAAFIAEHTPRFQGKRVIMTAKMYGNLDWLVDLLLDLKVDLVRLGFMPSTRKNKERPVSRHECSFTEDYWLEDLVRDMEELDPDLLICDVVMPMKGRCRFARMQKIGIGIDAELAYAVYLENMMRLPNKEGWREVAGL